MILERPARFTIAHAMTLVAATAILFSSTLPGHHSLLLLVLLILVFLLPWYFILRRGRIGSAAEACVASLAGAYLAWGALFLFHPTSDWRRLASDPIRWNLGAVAIFYVLLLSINAIYWIRNYRSRELRQRGAGDDASRRNHAPIVGWLPLGLGSITALSIAIGWGPGWLSVACLATAYFLAIAFVWRLRPAGTLVRSLSRIARAIPGILAGLSTGIAWNRYGWIPAAVVAILFVGGLILVRSFGVLSGRRARIAALAALWAFAVSTQFVAPPPQVLPGGRFKPRKVTALLPPPQQPPAKP